MDRGFLIVDAAKNTIVIDGNIISEFMKIGKIDMKKIRRNMNMKELNESIRNYLKGVYDNDGIDIQR